MAEEEQEWIEPSLDSWAGEDYPKHLPFYNREDEWEVVVKETKGKRPVSRYIHSLPLAVIRMMEFQCVTGTRTLPPNEIATSKPGVRVFWLELPIVVGASNGEETTLIRVELGQSGVYHGRPISQSELDREIRRRKDK